NDIDINQYVELYEDILLSLIKMDTKYKGVYNTFSYVLGKVLKSHQEVVIRFIEKWIKHSHDRANQIGLFRNLFIELYHRDYPRFKILVTNWLNSNDPSFHIAIFEIMRELKLNDINELELSREIITDLSSNDVRYIVAKILGFIYDKDLSKTLLYSILISKIDDEDITKLVASIFKDYLIFNYYSVMEYLENKSKISSKKEKRIIGSIIGYFGVMTPPVSVKLRHFERSYNDIKNLSFNTIQLSLS